MQETLPASAVREEPGETEPPSSFDPAIAEEVYRVVTAAGVARVLLMPRFMQVVIRSPIWSGYPSAAP